MLRYGRFAEELSGAIDQVRATLSAGLEAGKIRFSARRASDNSQEGDESEEAEAFGSAPSLDIMSNLTGIGTVLVDDRCLNKLPTWTDGLGQSAQAATSLDVLDELRQANKLDDTKLWRARHLLRAAGFYAIPVRLEELLHHLMSASAEDGQVIETPELRAIRESVAIARINNVFIPAETVWLNSIRFAVLRALRRLWVQSASNDQSEARANWLLSLMPDPLEWCREPEHEAVWAAARQQATAQAGLLLLFPEGKLEQRRRYFSWLNGAFIDPFRKERPEIWQHVITFLKSYILQLVEAEREA